MNSSELWYRIIERAKNQAFEVHTVPQSKREPLWYRISSDGNVIIISKAQDHKPSSTLKMPRAVTYKEFERVYPFYELRIKGESVSQDAGSKSLNTVYIYGLIAEAITL